MSRLNDDIDDWLLLSLAGSKSKKQRNAAGAGMSARQPDTGVLGVVVALLRRYVFRRDATRR